VEGICGRLQIATQQAGLSMLFILNGVEEKLICDIVPFGFLIIRDSLRSNFLFRSLTRRLISFLDVKQEVRKRIFYIVTSQF
jgi:hypothetical protein